MRCGRSVQWEGPVGRFGPSGVSARSARRPPPPPQPAPLPTPRGLAPRRLAPPRTVAPPPPPPPPLSRPPAAAPPSASPPPADRGDGLPPLPSLPRVRADWDAGPALHLSADAALGVQLDALAANDVPAPDHGVEVVYRFAQIELFTPCAFFGARADLGQFERWRYQFGTARFAPLRGLAAWRVVAAFDWQPARGGARALRRVAVTPRLGGPDALYDFTLGQRVGGPADGCWFTLSLTRVEEEEEGWSPQAPEV